MKNSLLRCRRLLRVENLERRHLMATVSGVVFNDVNGNGAQDAGDAVLAGQTVFLDLDGDSTVDLGELTDNSGSYSFPIPTLAALQNLHVGLVSPAAETNGRWQNTINNYQAFVTGPSGGDDTVLHFGVQFVPYSSFQPIGSERIVGDNIKVGYPYYPKQNVATDSSGNYAITFARDASLGKEQVNLRLFNSDDIAQSSEMVVTADAFNSAQTVAMSQDGSRVAVGWESRSGRMDSKRSAGECRPVRTVI